MELTYERTSKVFLSVFGGMLAKCKNLWGPFRKWSVHVCGCFVF
jgi:hypothetical protein